MPRYHAALGAAPGTNSNARNQFDLAKLAVYARTFSTAEAAFLMSSPPEGPHLLTLTPAPPNVQPNINDGDLYYTPNAAQGGSALPWTMTPGTSRTLKVSLPLPLEWLLPITLTIQTIPAGAVNPSSLTWDANQANSWRTAQNDKSFTLTLPVGSSSVQVLFNLSGPSADEFAAPLGFTVNATNMEMVRAALVTSATFNMSTFRTGFWRNPSYVALSPTSGYGVLDGAGQVGLSAGTANIADLSDGSFDAFMWPANISAVDRFGAAVPGRSSMSLAVQPTRAYALANAFNPTSMVGGMGWSWCGWVRIMQLPSNGAMGLWSALIPGGSTTNFISLSYLNQYDYYTYTGYVYHLRLAVNGGAVVAPYTLTPGRWAHIAVTMVDHPPNDGNSSNRSSSSSTSCFAFSLTFCSFFRLLLSALPTC